MIAVFEHDHEVVETEIDFIGHVNNQCYIQWMLEAAEAHSSANGWDKEKYLSCGAVWIVRTHHIDYRQPALAGDNITVLTWVSSLAKVRSTRKYRMVRRNDGLLIAEAFTDWALVDIEKHTPRRVPPDMKDAFVVVESGAEPEGISHSSMSPDN